MDDELDLFDQKYIYKLDNYDKKWYLLCKVIIIKSTLILVSLYFKFMKFFLYKTI